MGIGHTWHLQLHTLSEAEKGQLIYYSELSRVAEGAIEAFPFKIKKGKSLMSFEDFCQKLPENSPKCL